MRFVSILLTLLLPFHSLMAVEAFPEQQPDIGTNEQVWDAVDLVWKIRGSKKWGDTLNSKELAAVNLAFDSIDDWTMRNGEAYFTPQIFSHLFGADVVKATKIRVIAMPEVYAGFDKSGKTIDVSIGLLQAMYWTQWAIEEAKENPALQSSLGRFLFALSRNNFQRTPISASSVIRLTEFVTGKAWHPDNKLTNQIEERVSQSLLGALVFIVAHEGCHAELAHSTLAGGDSAIRQEWAADRCAVTHINGSYVEKFNPYLALGVLALFALDNQGKPREITTHPNALCRMGWMVYNNGANNSNSVAQSIVLLPLIVDAYKFPVLTQQQVNEFPADYRHPNFLAIGRISSYCGGYKVFNPEGVPPANLHEMTMRSR